MYSQVQNLLLQVAREALNPHPVSQGLGTINIVTIYILVYLLITYTLGTSPPSITSCENVIRQGLPMLAAI